MTKIIIINLILALTWATLAAQSQTGKGKPAQVAMLTEQEAAQWKQLGEADQQLQQALQATLQQAVNTPVGAQTSMEVHAAIKDVYAKITQNRLQRDSFVLNLRVEKECKACLIGSDGKTFAPQSAQK